MTELAAIAAALMSYAAWSTGLPVPDSLPNIVVMSPCEIQNHYEERPTDSECPDTDVRVGASYNFGDMTIRFPDDISFSSVRGRSILLHELVHYVQHSALTDMNPMMQDVVNSAHCQNAAFEPMAYRTQFEWLRMNKHDPYATIPTTPSLVILSTLCRPAYEIGG